jgi:hypothetical protein
MPLSDPGDSSETVLAAPPSGPVPPLTLVRGTLIVASRNALEKRGYAERYFAALPEEHHASIRDMLANSWTPEPVARAHYAACDALGLSSQEVFAIGGEVGDRVRATFLGTLASIAREAGTTPWVYLERIPRLFPRICVGGAVAIYKLGPKDARAEWYGLPGLSIPYFRTAFRGANQSIIALFCTKAYVSETPPRRGGDWAFRVSWA